MTYKMTAKQAGKRAVAKAKGSLRMKYQLPTETKGPGEWWWDEAKDGIRICHYLKGMDTALAFFSWAKIKGAVSRKRGS